MYVITVVLIVYYTVTQAPIFSVREMYSTNQLEVLKSAQSAAIMDPDHLLIGDSEGLYMLDMAEEGLYKFGDKDVRKVSQISMIEEEGLIVLLAGVLGEGCVGRGV